MNKNYATLGALLMMAASASAAPVTFSVADYADGLVSTNGTLVGALNANVPNGTGDVNTVTFSELNAAIASAGAIPLSGTATLTMFGGGATDIEDGANGAAGLLTVGGIFNLPATDGTLAFDGLTFGQLYEVQMIFSDTRALGGTDMDIYGAGDSSGTAFNSGDLGVAKIVTGTFTAGGDTQDIYLVQNTGNHGSFDGYIGALQIRDLGPAPVSGWEWTNAAGGSWATPGDWTPAGPADAADDAAQINLLDITGDQTITLDGSYTIGNVRFADTAGDDGNWILNPGSGGALTLSAPTNGSPGVIVINQTATVNAVLTGTEGMTKTGPGTLVLGAANTYTGGTFIDGGTVQIANTAAIPSGAGNGDVTLATTLDLDDNSIVLNGLTGSGTVTNSGVGSGILTIGDDDATASFGGVIEDGSGITNVVKTGVGVQTLTGINTFSGTLTVSDGGDLVVSNLLRNTSGITVDSGAVLELGTINMFTNGHGIPMADTRVLASDGGTLYMSPLMESRIGNVSLANGAIWTSDRGVGTFDILLADTDLGTATVTVANTGGDTSPSFMDGGGGIHLQGVQNFDVDDVTGDASADLEVQMILDGPGFSGGDTGGVNKLGVGTMLLTGANTYTGDTIVTAGTLALEPSAQLTFAIGANGVNNKVTGPGTSTLDGDFSLDLSGADTTTGNSWTLVDTTTNSFGVNFVVLDGLSATPFTEVSDVHTFVDGLSTWTFTEATGALTVTTVVNDYDNWAITNGYWTPGDPNSGPTEDFDGDSVVNEDEYAFGLDPTDGTSVNPISVTLDPVTGTFSYTRRDPILTSLSYTYEWSTDLAGWTAVVPAVADVVVPSGDNETVTVDLTGAPGDPLANTTLFVRVVSTP